ncbi:hypothetical protein ACLK19_00470 [Escherichia coli]
MEDSVVRRSSPIADSGDKLFKALCLFAAAVAGFSTALAIFCWAHGMSACTFAATAAKIAARAHSTGQRQQFAAGDQHVAAGLHNDLVFPRDAASAITLLTAIP